MSDDDDNGDDAAHAHEQDRRQQQECGARERCARELGRDASATAARRHVEIVLKQRLLAVLGHEVDGAHAVLVAQLERGAVLDEQARRFLVAVRRRQMKRRRLVGVERVDVGALRQQQRNAPGGVLKRRPVQRRFAFVVERRARCAELQHVEQQQRLVVRRGQVRTVETGRVASQHVGARILHADRQTACVQRRTHTNAESRVKTSKQPRRA